MTRVTNGAIQAVVFDLDGTLVDSAPDIAAAVNVALAYAGLAPQSLADITGMVGNGSDVLISRALTAGLSASPPQELQVRVHNAFLTAYDQTPCRFSKLYPGAIIALETLRAQGLRLGICTNKPHPITLNVLSKLGIADVFGSIVGGSDSNPLKPAPDMLCRVLADLQVAPHAAVMVGDSRADAGAARSAGTHIVLMTHGYSHDDLASLTPDALLPDFAGLPGALARMTERPG